MRYLLFILPALFTLPLGAQNTVPGNDSVPGAVAKLATATRIRAGSVRVDGKPDEPIWQTAQAVTDFLQKEPVENGKSTDNLEVRFLYDDDALYVATKVTKSTSRKIQAPVSRRDNISQAEHIWISLDSHRDRRTAYSFGVTASGVRGDWYHPADNETNIDSSFDPVWEAAANQTASGWTSKCGFISQLRFNASGAERG